MDNFKKLLAMFLICIILIQSSILSLADGTKPVENHKNSFITKVELYSDGELVGDGDVLEFYTKKELYYSIDFPNDLLMSSGDIFSYSVPEEFNVKNFKDVAVLDEGVEIGRLHYNRENNTLDLIINGVYQDKVDRSVKLKINVDWNLDNIKGDESLNIEFEGDGGNIDIILEGPWDIDENEKLNKWGNISSDSPNEISWVVRINYAKDTIKNAVFVDEIGENQELLGEIYAQYVKVDSSGNAEKISDVPREYIKLTKEGFKIDFNGDLDETVQILYKTKILGESEEYKNIAKLTGAEDFIAKVPIGDIGGEGQSDKNYSVKLIKLNDNNETLEGASFNLFDEKDTLLYENLKTDKNGEIFIKNLKAGSYKFIETEAPEGYILNNKPLVFELNGSSDGVLVLKFKNESKKYINKEGNVEILKIDEEGNPLKGVKFNLRRSDGEIIYKNLETNIDGKIFVENLAFGSYYFEEVETLEAYELDKEPLEFEIKEDQISIKLKKINKKKDILYTNDKLPKTGSYESKIGLLLGLILILTGLFVIVNDKKIKK